MPRRAVGYVVLLALLGCAAQEVEQTQLPLRPAEIVNQWISNIRPLQPSDETAVNPEPLQQDDPQRVSVVAEGVRAGVLIVGLARATGHNLVMHGDLPQLLSLSVSRLPLAHLLDEIASDAGVHLEESEDMISVSATPHQGPPVTQRIAVVHRTAEALLPLLQSLYPQVQFIADASQGSIWIRGRRSELLRVRDQLKVLDSPQRQVFIEAFIVEINRDSKRALGVQGYLDRGSATGALGDNLLLQFGTQVASAGLALINPAGQLRLQLLAMEQRGWSRILSNPRIFVLNHEQAEVFEGSEIPYTSTSERGTDTRFREAGLKLLVTPDILGNAKLKLDLQINKDTVDLSQPNPPVLKRKISTRVVVGDGDTLVIGGIYIQDFSGVRDTLPFLGRLPVIGKLFSGNRRSESTRELLVFLQPRILQ